MILSFTFLDMIPYRIIMTVVVGSLTILLSLGALLWFYLSRRRFAGSLVRALEKPLEAESWFHEKHSRKEILRRSDQVEEFVEKHGTEILTVTGIDRIWIDELKEKKGKKEFHRVIRHAPGEGLFPCFLASLEREELGGDLLQWLRCEGDFLPLRRLALSSEGESFPGKRALSLLKGELDQIRELAGDPEGTVRKFAITILIHEDPEEPRSRSIIEEALQDPRSGIRKFVLKSVSPAHLGEEGDLYRELYSLYVSDPVLEVRKAARERIEQEYMSRFALDVESLNLALSGQQTSAQLHHHILMVYHLYSGDILFHPVGLELILLPVGQVVVDRVLQSALVATDP